MAKAGLQKVQPDKNGKEQPVGAVEMGKSNAGQNKGANNLLNQTVYGDIHYIFLLVTLLIHKILNTEIRSVCGRRNG